ncbi:hypothetical protein ElyMa_003252000 [Elysia marginata]|uniref:Uncharacterized protein n=1 Tax=Elysia marginata TaxID=1093978 RepID=A0AAV4J8H1_9GAST|nr:hypothetical protein ElyMa_003252000 [Elysia marginata]
MLHGKNVEGRRARGRQRQTCMDSLSRFINVSNKSMSKMDIFRWTEDREAWKSLMVDVCRSEEEEGDYHTTVLSINNRKRTFLWQIRRAGNAYEKDKAKKLIL